MLPYLRLMVHHQAVWKAEIFVIRNSLQTEQDSRPQNWKFHRIGFMIFLFQFCVV